MPNTGNANRVGSDIKGLARQFERYLRLEATDRLTVMATGVALAAIVFALALIAVFFLGTGLVHTLTSWTGSEEMSYYLVGGGLLLLVLLLFILKKPMLEKPMLKCFSDLLLGDSMLTDRVTTGQASTANDAQIHELAKSLLDEFDDYDEEGGGL